MKSDIWEMKDDLEYYDAYWFELEVFGSGICKDVVIKDGSAVQLYPVGHSAKSLNRFKMYFSTQSHESWTKADIENTLGEFLKRHFRNDFDGTYGGFPIDIDQRIMEYILNCNYGYNILEKNEVDNDDHWKILGCPSTAVDRVPENNDEYVRGTETIKHTKATYFFYPIVYPDNNKENEED